MIIGLDVGGTHTDAVLLGPRGVVCQAKVATDPENLLESVRGALLEVTRGVPRGEISRAVLSTTLGTNAIAQDRLASVGMIVSGGPGIDPDFFRVGAHYVSVRGSIDHRGREVQAVDDTEIEAIRARLFADGIETVGVVGKFSVRNPAHELRIREILGDDFAHVFLGHTVSGHLSFPRRIATTYLNGAVYPVYRAFYQAVTDSLHQEGLDLPIHVLKADGGTMSLEASLALPAQTILSGPAASVMGSLPHARAGADTLVLDIGGTTTDLALLVNGVPLLNPHGIDVGPFRTAIRSLETRSLPVGGDSAVQVVGGVVRVGPERAGPAIVYGGHVATPTDAFFALDNEPRQAAARAGLLPLAAELGVSVEESAQMIIDCVCRTILAAARDMVEQINRHPVYTVHEVLEGYQVVPTELLVLGGPAPRFAAPLAARTPQPVRVVPRWQVANAIGAAIARTTCEVVLFADTERGLARAPEEGFQRSVERHFGVADAVELARGLLRDKALREGADGADLELDVVEELQFNMVRGFHTSGRNIRVKVQVKPGLIHDYRTIHAQLGEEARAAGP
jgi:N-methylhydantoinase A/oxoprolinase/acetone carboxylase beta subunit